MLADPCADPGIFAGGVQARLPENSSDNGFFLFCPQLLLFYSGFLMVYFNENYNFTRFRGVGVQHFPGGPNLFQGGQTFSRGGGVQMLILETHRTCDFPGGVSNPLSPSPLDPPM